MNIFSPRTRRLLTLSLAVLGPWGAAAGRAVSSALLAWDQGRGKAWLAPAVLAGVTAMALGMFYADYIGTGGLD